MFSPAFFTLPSQEALKIKLKVFIPSFKSLPIFSPFSSQLGEAGVKWKGVEIWPQRKPSIEGPTTIQTPTGKDRSRHGEVQGDGLAKPGFEDPSKKGTFAPK